MEYFPGLDDEDEESLEGPQPASTVAGPQTTREQVMKRISDVRSTSGDESDDLGSESDTASAMEFAKSSALTAGLGRGLNALASGTGFKADNSGYDAIEKRGADVASKSLDRSAQVRKAIEARKAKIASTEASNAFRANEGDKNRQAGIERARIIAGASRLNAEERRADRNEALETKKTEKELQLAVPGYERTGEVLPKVEEAQKFRDATAEANNLVKSLTRLKELVKNHGPYEYGGEAGAEMKSLVRDIQLQSKGPAMYQLGVLAGPDMEILEDITSDPESFSSMFTREGTRQSQIDTQLEALAQRIGSKAKALGYKEVGGKAPPPAHPPGSIVAVRGVRYRVGADGDSLEEIKETTLP